MSSRAIITDNRGIHLRYEGEKGHADEQVPFLMQKMYNLREFARGLSNKIPGNGNTGKE